jgi:hypothetical protein
VVSKIGEMLGDRADSLLRHECKTIPKEHLHVPGADWVDRIFGPSDRNPRVLANLERLFSGGRLANTGIGGHKHQIEARGIFKKEMRAGWKVPICWGATGLAAQGLWRREEHGGRTSA